MARGVDPKIMAEERARRALLEVRAHRGMHFSPWLWPAALALIAAIELAVLRGQTPPAPKPFDAPGAEFSAERARRVLERVVGDGTPRPTGSAANARARERIVAELAAIGLGSSLESGMVCGRSGVCARVNNVVAEIAGREAGRGVLLAAHYDSVPAGPGAGDDASGVAAILEIARVLHGAPPRVKVVLLFSDGEELGLLGAELFVRESRHIAELGAIVNLEARGTSGPSLMFETSPANARLVDALAATAARPVTSSALYEAYRRLPNDSDFSVFKARGLRGYNFAFIGGVPRYHTPYDEPKELALSSLQHHGDNALSALRSLTEAPDIGGGEDATFFDVASSGVIAWKSSRSLWLAVAAAFSLLLGLAVAVLRGSIRAVALAKALCFLPGALALCALAALGLELVLRAFGGLPAPWIAYPVPTVAACALLAIGSLAGLASLFGPEGAPALWTASFVWFAGGALLATRALPGTSFLLIVPALTAGLCGMIWLTLGRSRPLLAAFAGLAPIAATALTWAPALSLLYPAIGLVSLPAFALAFAVPLLALAPLFASIRRSWLHAVALSSPAMVAAAAGLALFLPRSSRDVPQWLSLAFHQDADTRSARYLADESFGPLPAAFRSSGLDFAAAEPRPWRGSWKGRARAAPAAALELAPPEFTVTSTENTATGRTVRGRLRSARRAPLVELEVPSPISLHVHGVKATPRFVPPAYVYTFVIDDANGVELILDLTASPIDALLIDHSFGLPEQGRSLAGLRSPSEVPFHFGDVTLVSRGVRL